jgi:hypothetical protein
VPRLKLCFGRPEECSFSNQISHHQPTITPIDPILENREKLIFLSSSEELFYIPVTIHQLVLIFHFIDPLFCILAAWVLISAPALSMSPYFKCGHDSPNSFC